MSTDEQTLNTEAGETTVVTTADMSQNATSTESAVEQPKEEVKSVNTDSSQQELTRKRGPGNPTGKGGFQDHPELINKNGAPKREWSWAGILEEIANEQHPKTKQQFKYLAARRAFFDAANGKTQAWEVIMDRMEGKPKQSTDLTSAGEKLDPLRVVIVEEAKQEEKE